MIWKALIIDDEPAALERLTRLLSSHKQYIEVLGKAVNGVDAVQKIDELQPDIIFLDIEMPGKNGFEVLKEIIHNPFVIFTTAYDEYALKAFENNSIDYLLKPIEKERLQKCIDKLNNQEFVRKNKQDLLEKVETEFAKQANQKSMPVRIGDKLILVNFTEIVYLEANDKYVDLHTQDGKSFVIEHSLLSLESKLPENFIRIQRSIIINKNYIKEIHRGFNSTYYVYMNTKLNTRLQSGRNYLQNIKQLMTW